MFGSTQWCCHRQEFAEIASLAGGGTVAVSYLPTLGRVIVRMADVADVATLAELQDIESNKLAAYADWVDAHAETHLPFVAEVAGHVVAAAWLLVADRVPRNDSLDRRYGDVQSVMVREEYRNQGIGAALMTAILGEARTRDLSHVTVHSGRRAVDFHVRNGFSHHRQLLIWEPAAP
jgi:GNAT superfamily N-acetyltransferase